MFEFNLVATGAGKLLFMSCSAQGTPWLAYAVLLYVHYCHSSVGCICSFLLMYSLSTISVAFCLFFGQGSLIYGQKFLPGLVDFSWELFPNTKADLPTWLTPKPGDSGPTHFSSRCAARKIFMGPFQGALGACFSENFENQCPEIG